jgi:chemotaxis protein methyltransferase CheR
MIYFDRKLQDRVHSLFYDSLVPFGFLGLGSKETLKFSKYEDSYEEIDARDKIYRRIK